MSFTQKFAFFSLQSQTSFFSFYCYITASPINFSFFFKVSYSVSHHFTLAGQFLSPHHFGISQKNWLSATIKTFFSCLTNLAILSTRKKMVVETKQTVVSFLLLNTLNSDVDSHIVLSIFSFQLSPFLYLLPLRSSCSDFLINFITRTRKLVFLFLVIKCFLEEEEGGWQEGAQRRYTTSPLIIQ